MFGDWQSSGVKVKGGVLVPTGTCNTLSCPALAEHPGPPSPPEDWKLTVSCSLLISAQTYSSFLVVSDASWLTFEPHSHDSQCPGT